MHELRDLHKIRFIVVKDKTGFLQVVLPKKEVSEEVFNEFDKLTKESFIYLEGLVKEAPNVKLKNKIELLPSKLKLIGKAETPTPIDTSGKIHTELSKRLDYRFLDLRDPKKAAIFEIRSKVVLFANEYLQRKGFTCIQTPKLTLIGCESGAELFEVKYFGRKAFLAQSPQLYKQMFVIAGFEKVYEIGPFFRAEKSHTTRHLAEFTGIDFEMFLEKGYEEIMDMAEGLVKEICKRVNEECKAELELLEKEVKIPKKIPRISIEEIRKILKEKYNKIVAENDDLDPEAERLSCKYAKEKFNEELIFVTEFPWEKRPFYHMKFADRPNLTKSFDLLWNGIEIATGSQREHRLEILKKQAEEKGINLEAMKDYAVIFKYGAMPHGGIGFGLDRIIEAMLQLENVREAVLLPRDTQRIRP